MQKRLRNDELHILRGEVEVDEAELDRDAADLDSSDSESNLQQPRQAAAGFVSAQTRSTMQTTEKGKGQAAVCYRAFFVHEAPLLGCAKIAGGDGAGLMSARARSTTQITGKGKHLSLNVTQHRC